MLKKSTTGANASAITAAEGISIITPTRTSSDTAAPAARDAAAAPSIAARAATTSSTVATIGSRAHTARSGAALEQRAELRLEQVRAGRGSAGCRGRRARGFISGWR